MGHSEESELREALKKDILEFTLENWRTRNKAVLLSQVGQYLTAHKRHNLSSELGGEKLAQFIEKELADHLRTVTSPEHSGVQGLVPVNEKPTNLVSLFPSRGSGDTPTEWRNPAFKPAVWHAFSRPIPAGMKRMMIFKPGLNYIELPESAETEPEARLIPGDKVIPIGSMPQAERNLKLVSNIREWLKQNGVPEEDAVVRGTPSTQSHAGDSLLDALIRVLTTEQLARVTMPLDVVAKLMKVDSRAR